MTFIALTLTGTSGIEPQPIFVSASHIRTVNPRWVKKPGQAHFELDGTWVCTGSGEEGTFPVIESYDEVTGAIRDALK